MKMNKGVLINNKKFHLFNKNTFGLFVLVITFFLIFSSIFIPIINGLETVELKTVDKTEKTSTTTTTEKTTTTSTTTTTEKTTTTPTTPKITTTPTTPKTITEEKAVTKEDSSNNSLIYNVNNTSYFNGKEINIIQPKKFIKINASIVKNNDSVYQNENEITVESSIGVLGKNTTVSVSIKNEEKTYQNFIEKVDFTSSNNHNNVKLTIRNLESKPVEVTKDINLTECKKIFRYVDIKLTDNGEYIGETGISSMTFTFTVEKSWIENESIDFNTIEMMRYHNNTWQHLNTTFLNETTTHLYFQAETPGLSVFAVVGDTLIEDSGAIVDGSTIFPWWVPFTVISVSTLLLAIVLVKKRYIYLK